tara:strand:+ start:185 stop:466 length:282 start_codon:yes stop_codon:yes gene_type:complete
MAVIIRVQDQLDVGNEVEVWGDTKDGMPRNGAAGARERSGMGRFRGNAEVSGVKGGIELLAMRMIVEKCFCLSFSFSSQENPAGIRRGQVCFR